MATQDTRDWWKTFGQAAPGLFDIGTGLFTSQMGNREAKNRLAAAQGPLYQQQMAGAKTSLDKAGGMDPKAHAAERFATQRGLLAGVDAKSEDDLMRMLHSKGMLGVANYNPGVEGINPSEVAMNPHMAAFYAARNARDAKMSADSMREGEDHLDRLIGRGGTLQGQAAGTQAAGLQAQRTQPSKAQQTQLLLSGIGGVLKDTGMFSAGVDWLKDWWSPKQHSMDAFW